MGGYPGHVVPGLVVGFWGSAWLVLTFIAHLKQRRKVSGGARRNDLRALRWEDGYKHYSWLPFPCAPRVPVEPILKIFLSVVGMIFELLLEKPSHEPTFRWQVTGAFNQPPEVEKAQHATMYSFFILSGVIDLVTMGACCHFPRKTAQLVLALALWVEASLFMFHIGGRPMLDARIHYILALAIYAGALAATARVYFPTKVLVNLALSVSFIFQGSWLVAIGLILYGDNRLWWEAGQGTEHEHEYAMLASMMAFWHLFCIVTVVLVLWGLVMTLNSCGIKGLLPLVHVPALPSCLKERLQRAAEATRTKDVLYEHARLMENGKADRSDVTVEMEASRGMDESADNAEIPTQ